MPPPEPGRVMSGKKAPQSSQNSYPTSWDLVPHQIRQNFYFTFSRLYVKCGCGGRKTFLGSRSDRCVGSGPDTDPIVWLTGARRTGKTVLARSLQDAAYLNCDLPSVAERLRDPESFCRSLKQPRVVFDEVHQLPDPSRLLKIGADGFPRLRILATGCSTLAATQKFRD